MPLPPFRDLLSLFTPSSQQPPRRKRPASSSNRRPELEVLEERIALATDTFTNLAGGHWSETTNWSLLRPPAAGDDAVLPALAAGKSVILDFFTAPSTIKSLTIDATLEVEAALTVTGNVIGGNVQGTGSLVLTGSLTGATVGKGVTIVGQGGYLTSATLVGTASGNLNIASGLTLDGGTLTVGTGTTVGSVDFWGTQTLGGSGNVIVHGGSFLDVVSTPADSKSQLTISQHIVLTAQAPQAGITTIGGPSGYIVDDGQIVLNGHSISFQLNNLSIASPSGQLLLDNGASATAPYTLTNAGSITLGDGSTLSAPGGYTQTSTGSLNIQIGEPPMMPQVARFSSEGAEISLAGTLAATYVNGFSPTNGQSFLLIDSGPRIGAFDTVTGGTAEYRGTFVFLNQTLNTAPIEPAIIRFNPNGSLDFEYKVTVPSLPKTTTVGVYWADASGVPSDLAHPMFTVPVTAGTTSGTYAVHVPAAKMVTAPSGATRLLVIADPNQILGANQSDETASLTFAVASPVTAATLQAMMPGLSLAAAISYAGPLSQVMSAFGIKSLEQEAMFLAQLAHESANLRTWRETYNGDANTYFINKYWVDKHQWSGLGVSVPTTHGLTLNVPHVKGSPTKVYKLYWAKGPTLTNSSTLYANVTFSYSNGHYTANYVGAVPPPLTTYLLIVDPVTNRVVQAIHNKLGNWSPNDATEFRGRGPIQLTGRYNYQLFATFAHLPNLMSHPEQLVVTNPKTGLVSNPEVGLQAAAFFWEELHNLDEVTDQYTGKSSVAFNRAITGVINGGSNGLADRLSRYRRIRAVLLSETT
jgi:predicted chitinase